MGAVQAVSPGSWVCELDMSRSVIIHAPQAWVYFQCWAFENKNKNVVLSMGIVFK